MSIRDSFILILLESGTFRAEYDMCITVPFFYLGPGWTVVAVRVGTLQGKSRRGWWLDSSPRWFPGYGNMGCRVSERGIQT